MKNRAALILSVTCSTVVLFGIMLTAADYVSHDRGAPSTARLGAGAETNCLAEGDVLRALQKLSLGTHMEADRARGMLVAEAGKSPGCRKQLIDSIVRAMDKPGLDFKSDPDSYLLWRDGGELLGDLKATEALDVLISHLDLKNGTFSTTMSHQPALRAVIKMGPVAIPKLAAVLRQNPNSNMRRYAVYCISGIGGDNAIGALKEALPSESDECVSRFIRTSIETLENESSGYPLDRAKWFRAFMCSD